MPPIASQSERNQATALWMAADSLRQEAESLRRDAKKLEVRAAEIDRMAAARANGEPMANA